jgi:dTDP-4-dehydrorhamnose reductase
MFLIVGGDSEIGGATYRAIKAHGKPVAATTRRPERVAPDRPVLDLSKPLSSWEPPRGTRAACVCAGVARLAACAVDPEGTAHINVVQTLALIEKFVSRGIYVLFLSTNQVFDGRTPHVPADAPHSPVSEYGRQKAGVEATMISFVARSAPVAILRLAKVISPGMPLFEGWIRDLAANKPIRAFHDMTLAPTPMELVCAAIGALLEDRVSGIFQLTGPRDVSYADVGRFFARYLGADPSLVKTTSARGAGLPEGATPLNTTLDSNLLHTRYGFKAPDVWDVVERVGITAKKRLRLPITCDGTAGRKSSCT